MKLSKLLIIHFVFLFSLLLSVPACVSASEEIHVLVWSKEQAQELNIPQESSLEGAFEYISNLPSSDEEVSIIVDNLLLVDKALSFNSEQNIRLSTNNSNYKIFLSDNEVSGVLGLNNISLTLVGLEFNGFSISSSDYKSKMEEVIYASGGPAALSSNSLEELVSSAAKNTEILQNHPFILEHSKVTIGEASKICNFNSNFSPILLEGITSETELTISGGSISNNSIVQAEELVSVFRRSLAPTVVYEDVVEILDNNNIVDQAGAIFAAGSKASINFSSGDISNNIGKSGAIILTEGASMEMSDSASIDHNTGTHYSGAVFIDESATLTMNGGSISYNSTFNKGGAIYTTDYGLFAKTYTTNSGKSFLGGVNYSSERDTDGFPKVTNNEIRNPGGNFVLNGGILEYNNALLRGGAINVESNGVHLYNGTISNNRCSSLGGGIYVEGGNLDNHSYTLILGKKKMGNSVSDYHYFYSRFSVDHNTAEETTVYIPIPNQDAVSSDLFVEKIDSETPGYHGGGLWLGPEGSFGYIGTSRGAIKENLSQSDSYSAMDIFLTFGHGSVFFPYGREASYNPSFQENYTCYNEYFSGPVAFYNTSSRDFPSDGLVTISGNIAQNGGGIASNGTVFFEEETSDVIRVNSSLTVEKQWAPPSSALEEIRLDLLRVDFDDHKTFPLDLESYLDRFFLTLNSSNNYTDSVHMPTFIFKKYGQDFFRTRLFTINHVFNPRYNHFFDFDDYDSVRDFIYQAEFNTGFERPIDITLVDYCFTYNETPIFPGAFDLTTNMPTGSVTITRTPLYPESSNYFYDVRVNLNHKPINRSPLLFSKIDGDTKELLPDATIQINSSKCNFRQFSSYEIQFPGQHKGSQNCINNAVRPQTIISTSSPIDLDLSPGYYIFSETSAPQDYILAYEIFVEITADGRFLVQNKEVNSIVLENFKPGFDFFIIKVNSLDFYVRDAKLQLCEVRDFVGSDYPYTVVDGCQEFITDNPKKVRLLPDKTYRISEISTPDNYIPAEDVFFHLDTAGNLVQVSEIELFTLDELTVEEETLKAIKIINYELLFSEKILVNKLWNDLDSRFLRPSSVEVSLYDEFAEKVINTISLESPSWHGEFEIKPEFSKDTLDQGKYDGVSWKIINYNNSDKVQLMIGNPLQAESFTFKERRVASDYPWYSYFSSDSDAKINDITFVGDVAANGSIAEMFMNFTGYNLNLSNLNVSNVTNMDNFLENVDVKQASFPSNFRIQPAFNKMLENSSVSLEGNDWVKTYSKNGEKLDFDQGLSFNSIFNSQTDLSGTWQRLNQLYRYSVFETASDSLVYYSSDADFSNRKKVKDFIAPIQITNSLTQEGVDALPKLKISKRVHTNLGPQDQKDFNFKISIWTLSEDSKNFFNLSSYSKLTDNGDGTYSFSLHHGESIEFFNLAENCYYEVLEENYSDEGYITSINGELRSSLTGEISQSDTEIIFVNSKNVIIPTGLDPLSKSFISILLLFIPSLLFFLRKRRTH